MVDVGRQNGTSGSYFVAYKFRSDVSIDTQFLAVHVFTDGNVFHFRSYDTLFGIIHLCAAMSCFGAIGESDMFEAQMVERLVVTAHLSVFRSNGRQLFHVTTSGNPAFTHTGKSFFQINGDGWVAERTAGVIDVDRCVRCHHFLTVYDGYGRSKVDFLHSYTDEREHLSLHVGFLGVRVGFIFFFFHVFWWVSWQDGPAG